MALVLGSVYDQTDDDCDGVLSRDDSTVGEDGLKESLWNQVRGPSPGG